MKAYIELIEEELESYNFGSHPHELYEPINYILSLDGKRLRPVLTLMTYRIFNDNYKKAIYPALGVEVFHNFTLLHDDIMDNAPIRRGSPTVHEKWNENIAILSGDVMLIRAYELFIKSGFGDLERLLIKFNKCASEVCEGQQYDMNFESTLLVTETDYLEMIKLKTAVLIGFAAELGAILGGADEKTSDQFYEFGVNIGIAFQLKDDLLDVFADTNKFGKQTGGDIISNKKTYLLIKALENAKNKTKEELDQWLKKKDFDPMEKVDAMTGIYKELGIKKLTESKMNSYFTKGLAIFDSIDIEESKKLPLKELSLKLMDREK